MATQQVIPWNPSNDLSSNPSLKQAYASAVGSAAANRAKQLQSAKDLELAAADKYAAENGDTYEKYSALSERGGKRRKTVATKRRKSRRKSRKTKKHLKRRKL
jgi:hypothetical protein